MLAEILSAHWPAYVAKFGRLIPAEQHAAVRAILRCRTPALGGQRYRCACGREHFAYHSCNHRACPRCGRDDAAEWLAKQRTRLLPVPYFLITFTLPEQLREPVRAARKLWNGALLKESVGTLQDLAGQPKHLGAELNDAMANQVQCGLLGCLPPPIPGCTAFGLDDCIKGLLPSPGRDA